MIVTEESEAISNFDVLDFVRKEQFKDRFLLEKGTQAFISHIRSYKEHKLSFIFRLADLNMYRLAKAFVLFRVPKLKELRLSRGIKNYPEVSMKRVKAIKFKDKQKEKQRNIKYEREKISRKQRSQRMDKIDRKKDKGKKMTSVASKPKLSSKKRKGRNL